MTAQQQVLFTCDCCATTAVLPLFNKPPMDRMRPPEKWTVMTLDDNRAPQPGPMHLCGPCSTNLRQFFNTAPTGKQEVFAENGVKSDQPYTHTKDWPA